MIYCYPTWFDCVSGAATAAAEKAKSLKDKVLLFTEDELTLTAETELVKKTGGTFGAEVISFGRYIQKHAKAANSLSKEGGAMAIKKILSSLKSELSAFKSVAASPTFAGELFELIAQLKSAKVKPENLDVKSEDFPFGVYAKIHDIRLVFSKYEEFLKDSGLTDSGNSLAEIPELVKNDKELKKTHVLFVGYSSVTRSIIDAVKAFYETALSCDFFLVENPDYEVYTREFYNFARTLTGGKFEICPSSASSEALRLLGTLYEPTAFAKEGLYSDKVSIFEAKNISDECDFIASRIRYEVIENGLRYEDIAIGVGGIEEYKLTLRKKLADYSIPFFMDEKKTLSAHPALKLIECMLTNAERHGDIEEIKKAVSNGIFIAEKAEADEMIYKIIKNSVTAKTFLGDAPLGFDILATQKREAISRLFKDFKFSHTAKDYTKLLRLFLEKSGAYDNANTLSGGFIKLGYTVNAEFCIAGMKKLDELFTEIENILGNEQVSVAEFKKILLSGAEATEISMISAVNLDCVYVSELKDCRYKQHKILFAAGLNANVPPIKEDVALLRDGDIRRLDELSVKIEPKIRTVNKREREAYALALLSFENNLFISYSVSGRKSEIKSELIDYVVAAFSDKKKSVGVFNRLSLEKARKYTSGERKTRIAAYDFLSVRPAMFSLVKECDDFKSGAGGDINSISSFYFALKKYDEKQLAFADRLIERIDEGVTTYCDVPNSNYFFGNNVSASVLETYYSCPYKNFLRYGVGLSDNISSDPKALDYGNIFHSVAEKFVKSIDKVTDETVKETAEKLYEEESEKEEYHRFLQRISYEKSSVLLKAEAVKLCKKLYEEYKTSGFKTVGTEVWFSDFGEYKTLPIRTKNGNYKLWGKADRVDKYTDEKNNTYVRIIDYKTGEVDKKVKDESLYTGRNLQLYLYMNAFLKDGEEPAGAYYYAIEDEFSKEDETTVSMRGKTVSAEEIILATDKNFKDNRKSDIVAVKYDSRTKEDKLAGEVTDDKGFKAYMGYALKMAENGVRDITDGVIISSPYDEACKYCDYKGLCRHDDSCDRTRKTKDVKSKTILNAMGVVTNEK